MSLLKNPIFTVPLNRTIKILIFHLSQDLSFHFTCELFHVYFIFALNLVKLLNLKNLQLKLMSEFMGVKNLQLVLLIYCA